MIGSSVGLVEWRRPRKLGGKVDGKVSVDGTVQDIQFSATERGVLGIISSSGVLGIFALLMLDDGSEIRRGES